VPWRSCGGGADAVPDSSPSSIACVVLTWNQCEKTLRCLESLHAMDGPACRIAVWDNGSHDGTEEAVRARFPSVLFHHHSTNLGVASGRNAGAELALRAWSPSHLLFLDNDIVVEPGFAAALLAPFRERPRLGQTQAKLRFLDAPERLNDGGGCRIRFWRGQTIPVGFDEIDRGQYDEARPCIACGGAMMVRADVFRELGGFDARFDPVGPEDLDFSLRLQSHGYEALYVPAAVGYHGVSHSFGGGAYTEAYARHKARNWFVFLMRHASLHQKLGFFLLGLPFLAARALVREARRGNVRAMRGLVTGLMEFLGRRSAQKEPGREPEERRAGEG
jgi:GT2 family glycosyltransferase